MTNTLTLVNYPPFFEEKLRGSKWRSAIDSSVTKVSEILQVSHLPFFSDYTDHGPQHLSKVAETSEKLLADTAREVFSAEDTAILMFSILLHDLAMHLSEAGFSSLVNSKYDQTRLSLDQTPWPEAWSGFLEVARHWDDRILTRLFGANEDGEPLALVSDPFEHYCNLTESDRKLIGEFIRRHHARMAHEFAVFGFPGCDGERIEFDGFMPELRDLAGIAARSHGMSLRSCFSYLEQNFNKLEYENVHPVFIMSLLRIADYLDLGKDRAPLITFHFKELRSPVSQEEFKVNQAFRTISWGNPDSESIDIPAKPADVREFLKLKEWLTAIQSELDTSWAVLGEIYGSSPRLSKLRLSIRRTRSNVDDVAQFAKTSSFVPRRVELGVARAQVLRLLIQPLYGDRPEYGIRELVQNAVDAVRERWQFVHNHPELASVKVQDQEGDVVVWLDDPDESGTANLTVSDQGIGMTQEIICDYFLKAGGTFRENIAWKREFEDNRAASLKSKVLRSGRFGIGVLAAFLLGDEIEVSTRHVTSHRGIHFRVRLDSRRTSPDFTPIQLDYDERLSVGTTIRIKVRRTQLKSRLDTDIFSDNDSWDWYALKNPSVVRLLGKNKGVLKQSQMVPDIDDPMPPGWHAVPSTEYKAVHMKEAEVSGSQLFVNGIRVRSTERWQFTRDGENWAGQLFPRDIFFGFQTPSLSLFDPDGRAPLNLRRTGLTTPILGFADDAFDIQAKALLVHFLRLAPSVDQLTAELNQWLRSVFTFENILPVFFTRSGTALLTPPNLHLAAVESLLAVDHKYERVFYEFGNSYDGKMFLLSGKSSSVYGVRDIRPWAKHVRLIFHKQPDQTDIPVRRVFKESDADSFTLYTTRGCPASRIKTETLRELTADQKVLPGKFLAAELFLDPKRLSAQQPHPAFTSLLEREAIRKSPTVRSPLGELWNSVVREPSVPFDHRVRHEKLSHLFDLWKELLP
jgi:hypothetical protein